VPLTKDSYLGRDKLLHATVNLASYLAKCTSTSIGFVSVQGKVKRLVAASFRGLKVFNCFKHAVILRGYILAFLKACCIVLFLKVC
jgi:hypothetical protein